MTLSRLSDEALLSAFLGCRLDNRDFHHAEHVRVAFMLLRRRDFGEATTIFRSGLKAIAASAGKPAAYHETITLAFLSLVGEHLARENWKNYPEFIRANPDLLDKSLLLRWYAKERLASETARKTFLLPLWDRSAGFEITNARTDGHGQARTTGDPAEI